MGWWWYHTPPWHVGESFPYVPKTLCQNMETRFRKWFIRATKINDTSNGVYEYDFEKVYNELKCRYDVVVYVVHDKDSHNVHAHFCIHNCNAIRFSSLKKIFPYGDIEKQKGSNSDVYNYMLHRNSDKTLYNESDIISNIDISNFINAVDDKDLSTGQNLIETIQECNTLFEVFKKNPNTWHKANCVVVIWNSYLEYKTLKIQLERQKKARIKTELDLIDAFGDLKDIDFIK